MKLLIYLESKRFETFEALLQVTTLKSVLRKKNHHCKTDTFFALIRI